MRSLLSESTDGLGQGSSVDVMSEVACSSLWEAVKWVGPHDQALLYEAMIVKGCSVPHDHLVETARAAESAVVRGIALWAASQVLDSDEVALLAEGCLTDRSIEVRLSAAVILSEHATVNTPTERFLQWFVRRISKPQRPTADFREVPAGLEFSARTDTLAYAVQALREHRDGIPAEQAIWLDMSFPSILDRAVAPAAVTLDIADVDTLAELRKGRDPYGVDDAEGADQYVRQVLPRVLKTAEKARIRAERKQGAG